MQTSQILQDQVGIQRNPVIDKSEGVTLPSLLNGVIIGKFKRGFRGRPFIVTKDNYKEMLGNEPSNPSFMAVEDAFSGGLSQLTILRTGGTSVDSGDPLEGDPPIGSNTTSFPDENILPEDNIIGG